MSNFNRLNIQTDASSPEKQQIEFCFRLRYYFKLGAGFSKKYFFTTSSVASGELSFAMINSTGPSYCCISTPSRVSVMYFS